MVGVTGGADRVPIEIDVAVADANAQTRVAVYVGTDEEGFDGVMIADGLIPVDGVIHTVVDSDSIAAGEYHLYTISYDDMSIPIMSYASQEVVISNPPQGIAVTIGTSDLEAVRYTDADGTIVTVALKSGGTATVTLSGDGLTTRVVKGTVVIDNPVDGIDIALANTTGKSGLAFTTKGGDDKGITKVGRITGSTPMGALTGKLVDLTGEGIVMADDGSFASITLHDLRNGADIALPGSGAVVLPKGTTITLQDVPGDSAVSLAAPLASFTVNHWALGGSIAAPWIGKLTTKVLKPRQLTGDFGASLDLTGVGAPKSITLGTVTIAGQITGGEWNVTGSAGAISAASIANAWAATIDNGDIKSLTTKTGALSGALTARSVAAITTKTDLINATLRLTQPVGPLSVKKLGLGKLTVGGWMDHATVRADGRIGAVTAGAMSHSLLVAGIKLTQVNLPDSADDFIAHGSIGSVTLKGLRTLLDPHSFINSSIAAADLGKLNLRGLKRSNDGMTHGLAAETIASLKTVQPDGTSYTYPGKWLDAPGDLAVRLIDVA